MPKYPKITSRKIKYDSPSGFVELGKYIEPFEKVKDGFGFMGVIVEDSISGALQCHICGKWMEQLHVHLKTHGLNNYDYKKRFGLLQSTALQSKKLRLMHSKVMIELRKKNLQNNHKFERKNLFAGNRKDKPKAVESKNKFGVCDLQIKDRILKLHEQLGKTPTLIDLSKVYGAGFMTLLRSRYGSYIQLCKNLGLEPGFSKFNPKYSREYFIEKAMNNEPSIRIYTINEGRALYKYFKGGIKEIRQIVMRLKNEPKIN